MKGNAIIGQSGGPTAVINASIAGVFKTCRQLGARHVYGMIHGIQGFLDGKYFDMEETIKTDLDLEMLKRTPSAYLGSCRFKLPKIEEGRETYEEIIKKCRELNIKYFFYAGGNDSMDTIHRLAEYAKSRGIDDIKFIGVIKTIDNDLQVTDHSPGYGSAAKYVATTVKEIIIDAIGLSYKKKQVTIMEIMGRDAGWLTGASALAKGEDNPGPDLIYLPEVPFDIDRFIEKIKALLEKKDAVNVCVSEGIKLADGRYVTELDDVNEAQTDAFGHKQLTGTAFFLANYVQGKLGIKTRSIEFSTCQRAASHIASGTDVEEAFTIGATAAKAADNGETGVAAVMIREPGEIYHVRFETAPVAKIANEVKSVPMDWIDTENDFVTEEFIRYARPLILEETSPLMVEGVPRHAINPYVLDI